jgi:hypothetical protein
MGATPNRVLSASSSAVVDETAWMASVEPGDRRPLWIALASIAVLLAASHLHGSMTSESLFFCVGPAGGDGGDDCGQKVISYGDPVSQIWGASALVALVATTGWSLVRWRETRRTVTLQVAVVTAVCVTTAIALVVASLPLNHVTTLPGP